VLFSFFSCGCCWCGTGTGIVVDRGVCLRACGVGSGGVLCGIIPQKSVGPGEREGRDEGSVV